MHCLYLWERRSSCSRDAALQLGAHKAIQWDLFQFVLVFV